MLALKGPLETPGHTVNLQKAPKAPGGSERPRAPQLARGRARTAIVSLPSCRGRPRMAASGGVGPVGPAVLASLGSLLLPSYHLALPILLRALTKPTKEPQARTQASAARGPLASALQIPTSSPSEASMLV